MSQIKHGDQTKITKNKEVAVETTKQGKGTPAEENTRPAEGRESRTSGPLESVTNFSFPRALVGLVDIL